MMTQGKKTEVEHEPVSAAVERYEDLIAAGHVDVMEQRRLELKEGLVLPSFDVKELRRTLGLSQDDFAFQYGIPLAALRNWEQKRRRPDTMANILLHMIREDPKSVAEAIAKLREGT